MGCNAWNHSANCDCGWGGGNNSSPPVNYASGISWSLHSNLNYSSYTNPNAKCPVCGASVFFYQSPYGGRVFFDELGPPWPKHPCTDNSDYRKSTYPVFGNLSHGSEVYYKKRASSKDWLPVFIKRLEITGEKTIIHVDKSKSFSPFEVIIYNGHMNSQAPMLWRFYDTSLLVVEISTIDISESYLGGEIKFTSKSWISDGDQSEALSIHDLESEQLCNIANSISFAHKTNDTDWQNGKHVDWKKAIDLYQIATNRGYWHAENQLAVIFHNGFSDSPKNFKEAFRLFNRSAQKSLDKIAIQNLRHCYREGVGTTLDEEEAMFLDELLSIM